MTILSWLMTPGLASLCRKVYILYLVKVAPPKGNFGFPQLRGFCMHLCGIIFNIIRVDLRILDMLTLDTLWSLIWTALELNLDCLGVYLGLSWSFPWAVLDYHAPLPLLVHSTPHR